MTLICGQKGKYLEYNKELYCFRKVALVGSLLGPVISPAMGGGLVYRTKHAFPIGEWALRSTVPLSHHCRCLAGPTISLLWLTVVHSWVGQQIAPLSWQLALNLPMRACHQGGSS